MMRSKSSLSPNSTTILPLRLPMVTETLVSQMSASESAARVRYSGCGAG